MAKRTLNVRFHIAENSKEELDSVASRGAVRGVGRAMRGAAGTGQFNNDEAAARFYLGNVLDQDARPAVRGLAAPNRPEVVPDLHLKEVQNLPLTKTRLVRFEQTQSSIPIFGSQVIVEIDQKRELVSVDGELVDIGQISPVPSISQKDALAKIAKLAKVSPDTLQVTEPATLTFYYDEKKDIWHLAFFFKKVPLAPKKFMQAAKKRTSHGHGMGSSPRRLSPQLNYLVDAHDGEVLFYYSANPMIVLCKGVDELSVSHKFYGFNVANKFEMNDPLRKVKTYDLSGKDMTGSFPKLAIRNAAADYKEKNRAAVSAHVNASRVVDFYRSVLMRDSVDDKGMELISVVNCTYSEDEDPPEWHNAVWYDNRMWYGQAKDGGGMLRSYARYLDIIAHELTHGVTETTSNLVYDGESGALNESFSDIFGVIINNWYTVGADSDVAGWSWEIGPGMGENGLPLRDMSNPKRTGDPDHMKKWLETDEDNHGVHTNSNIHNKAAYNVLTATDTKGQRVFPVRDVALLYYLSLSRLNSLATFPKTLRTLVDAAQTLYMGDKAEQAAKVKHIRNAYKKVGIT